jgi:hypothetical protein
VENEKTESFFQEGTELTPRDKLDGNGLSMIYFWASLIC